MNDQEKQKHYQVAERLISEQNFTAAVVGGAVAAVLAAVAYGIVVSLWRFSYGFAAAGIGIAVGLAMGYLGRGISMKFSVVAAVYTIAGCLLGSLFRVIVPLITSGATTPGDILQSHSFPVLAGQAVSYLSLIDFVYWFVAVFAAVFLTRRSLSRSERLAIGAHAIRR